jgi:hypothetical protein
VGGGQLGSARLVLGLDMAKVTSVCMGQLGGLVMTHFVVSTFVPQPPSGEGGGSALSVLLGLC